MSFTSFAFCSQDGFLYIRELSLPLSLFFSFHIHIYSFSSFFSYKSDFFLFFIWTNLYDFVLSFSDSMKILLVPHKLEAHLNKSILILPSWNTLSYSSLFAWSNKIKISLMSPLAFINHLHFVAGNLPY